MKRRHNPRLTYYTFRLIWGVLFATMLLFCVILLHQSLRIETSIKLSGTTTAKETPSNVQSDLPENTATSTAPTVNESMTTTIQFIFNYTVNLHAFKFIIPGTDICNSSFTRQLFIVTVVHTAPQNFKRRQVIRQTWGSRRFWPTVRFIVVFALGITPNNDRLQKKILMESDVYKDIIQADFVDSYKNLSYKGMMWLQWASEHCSGARFLLKTDDDLFVNVFTLAKHFHMLSKKRVIVDNTISCLQHRGMPVIREEHSKWYVSPDEYSDSEYSTYCSGSAWVITMDLVQQMHLASYRVRFFWVDDFYLTGLLPRAISSAPTWYDIGSLFVFSGPGSELEDKLVNGFAVFGVNIDSVQRRYRLWQSILNERSLPIERENGSLT